MVWLHQAEKINAWETITKQTHFDTDILLPRLKCYKKKHSQNYKKLQQNVEYLMFPFHALHVEYALNKVMNKFANA